MSTLNKILFICMALVSLLPLAVLSQSTVELSTLFTTEQERRIINSNRYKVERKPQVKIVIVEEPKKEAIQQLIKEEVKATYTISGITVNTDGSSSAWINNKNYENLAVLDDGSKVKINNSAIKSVTIKTPDGKRHTATSGEKLDVTYLRVVKE